jgi:hypothetical protein
MMGMAMGRDVWMNFSADKEERWERWREGRMGGG